ncbi:16094_t:CDS:1 [Acaulospora colombiana]|uniref:16094_t:CDS:1 n=1 Tax=Acaulospora colombiana TaxID=27376 RepID=A0ACA9L1K0_9GLOM|nr:16094_t:CDS:1 [Acaulospora colombiana]
MTSKEEELKKRKTYLQIAGTACSNCRKTSAEVGINSLLRCTRCRMSVYCSKECQKKDFSFHKQFCAAIEELHRLEEAWYSCNDKESEWSKRNIYHMQLLSEALDRELTNYERNAWLHQPKCHVCFRTSRDLQNYSPLIPCSECKVAFCCSPEHWKQYRPKHQSLCQTYQLMVNCERIRFVSDYIDSTPLSLITIRIDRYQDTSETLWAPEEWDESAIYPPLPKDWNGYFKWRKNSQFIHLDALCGVITNNLSLPLTILSALERFYIRSKLRSLEDLIIHIIGASQYEILALMTFEEIMHVLPNIKTLRIIFVGLELPMKNPGMTLQCCPRCANSDRKRICAFYPMPYHEYGSSSDYTIPHISVGFNTGLYEDDTELWKPTIEFLLEKELPCVFTSYSKEEATQDLKILKSWGAKILVGAKENKWRSTMPLIEPQGTDKFYYNNFYRTLLQGHV